MERHTTTGFGPRVITGCDPGMACVLEGWHSGRYTLQERKKVMRNTSVGLWFENWNLDLSKREDSLLKNSESGHAGKLRLVCLSEKKELNFLESGLCVKHLLQVGSGEKTL